MSIIYAVIVRLDGSNQTTLCNYDAAHGNYPTITEQILKKIKIIDKISYKYSQEYYYHIYKDSNLLFVCLAESNLKMKTAYVFLDQIRKKFKEKYSQEDIANGTMLGMNSTFSQIFKQQFVSIALSQTFYNTNKDPDHRQTLNKELEKLQEIMNQNIEKVLQREEKVQMTVKKATKLQSIAQQIQNRSKRMNQEAFWAKHKCKFLIVALLVAVGAGAFLII